MKAVHGLFLCLLLYGSAVAQTSDIALPEAWEPEIQNPIDISPPASSQFSLITHTLIKAINYYQEKISPQSISRCPFEISCSNFAKKAIEKKGVFGLIIFLNRYYFRENAECFSKYKIVQTQEGILKLDDASFLE
jgi:putative component of membrane protein insertase Oxa1/YidC/SpoIIIJ protein YidD